MGHMMLAVVLWKKLRHDILSTGLKENAVIRALYIHQEDGEPKSMLATHVDYMLWASKPGYEDLVTSRPFHDKDGGIRYVSILWTRSDTTL